DGGGGGVAVALEVDEEAVGGEFEILGDRVDDAQIGLVGNDAVDLRRAEVVLKEDFAGGVLHFADGVFKDLAAAHGDDAPGGVGIAAGRGGRGRMKAAAAADAEQIGVGSVGVEFGAEDGGGAAGGAEHDGSGTVTEEHAGGAVGPIEHGGNGLGA